ncbi:tetratricopeptide repeat protein [Selenomonas sp. ND2010]|uniref:tetratricopeptide repeat protein n=1 Tax=Selenomonas sp. ND2010 TaxID=1410618 RepID=UPI00051B37B9|nr:tetratricopeptide repeat protein [Selenomonas sp. ND2010]
MARKVKFALILKDGYEARNNIDEIIKYWDYNRIIHYFMDGRLVKWLKDRNYETEANTLLAIDISMNDFRNRIYSVFNIEIPNLDSEKEDGEILQLALICKDNDRKKYISLLMKAAEYQNPVALRLIGEYYTEGSDYNYDIAKEWLEKAIIAGDVESLIILGAIYYYYYENPIKAKEYYKIAADKGNAEGMYGLGKVYSEFENNKEKALYWYKEAAKGGDADAMLELGVHYLNEDRFDDAIIWFSRSAMSENAEAQNKMGEMFFQGLGRDVDLDMALTWFEKSANGGSAEGMYNLAQCYDYGYDVKRDKEKADYWYEKAHENGIDDVEWFIESTKPIYDEE